MIRDNTWRPVRKRNRAGFIKWLRNTLFGKPPKPPPAAPAPPLPMAPDTSAQDEERLVQMRDQQGQMHRSMLRGRRNRFGMMPFGRG